MTAFDEAWAFLKAEKPFRMKRPEMVDESTGIMDELARREWNRGDKGKDEFGDFGPEVAYHIPSLDDEEGDQPVMSPAHVDFEGRIEHGDPMENMDHISDETFRSTRPEMEERLLAIQTELARRGRPAIGEKFRDTHEMSENEHDGSTMWEESPSLAQSMLAENKNLVDEMGEEGKDLHEFLLENPEWFEALHGVKPSQ